MMLNIKDLYWLAGLIEGEGSFMWNSTPTIAVQMTDEDVINRACKIIGIKPRNPYQCKKGNRKLVYHFAICGSRAISWMMTLYSLMGERRKANIRELLLEWKSRPGTPRAPNGERWKTVCGHELERRGFGLCKACYMKAWRKRTGRNGSYYRKQKVTIA